MFDVGFQELLLIFVIGLLILGPERLPRVAAQLGRWVAKARRTASQLRYQLEREVALEEIYKTQKKPPSRPGTTAPGTTDSPGTAASATGTQGAPTDSSKAGGTEAAGTSAADTAHQAAPGSGGDAAASGAAESERAPAGSPATAADDATPSVPANAEALVSVNGAADEAEDGEFRQSGNAR